MTITEMVETINKIKSATGYKHGDEASMLVDFKIEDDSLRIVATVIKVGGDGEPLSDFIAGASRSIEWGELERSKADGFNVIEAETLSAFTESESAVSLEHCEEKERARLRIIEKFMESGIAEECVTKVLA